jgi:hypothetical protein
MTFNDLWQEYEETRRELNAICPMQGPFDNHDPRVGELTQDLKSNSELVLAHPYAFDNVKCWMVDAVGQQAECDLSSELIAELGDDVEQNLGHRYMERFGALPTEVRRVMCDWNLTDSGGGGGSWHLGCHCTEKESRELCSALYGRFSNAIDSGILIIKRRFWSLKLKT